jgi:hypothetical protein
VNGSIAHRDMIIVRHFMKTVFATEKARVKDLFRTYIHSAMYEENLT